MTRSTLITLVSAVLLSVAATGHAQTFDLSWHTIDGGGHTFSAGGGFSLGGTIGQADAGSAMIGGVFELTGGFWPGSGAGGGGTCIYEARKNSKAKGGCETCPQKNDRFSSGDECLGPNECAAKVKLRSMDCPGGGDGSCTKVKGKRVDCGAP